MIAEEIFKECILKEKILQKDCGIVIEERQRSHNGR